MWSVATRQDKDPSFNYLAFIDNQGIDLRWQGIKQIAPDPRGDLLINFPSGSIVRPAKHDGSQEAMQEFYGSGIWKEDRSRDALLDSYCTRLAGVERPTHVVTNVHSGKKNYQYDMIYATKEDADYIQAIEYVRDFVEEVDGQDVEQLIEIVNGNQDTLIDLLPDRDNNEDDNDGFQTGLGEF